MIQNTLKRILKRTYRYLLGSILFTFILFLVSACKVENQDPKRLFVTEKLPRLLDKMANRGSEFAKKETEILKIIAARKNKPKYKVAVIDSGVDIFHEDIFRRIHWEMRDGKISAGYDVMAGDYRAEATLINPYLFAYGAKEIIDDRISGEVESPLKLLGQHNDAFVKLLLKNLKAAKELDGTFFRKLNEKNISIFGAESLLNEGFDIDRYKKSEEIDRLMHPNDLKLSQKKLEEKIGGNEDVFKLVRDWHMKSASGLPFTYPFELFYFT